MLGGKLSSVEIRNRCSEASPHLWKQGIGARRQALICGNKESVLGGKPSSVEIKESLLGDKPSSVEIRNRCSVEIRNRCSEASPHLWK